MLQLYLVRHGQKNSLGGLTQYGATQVAHLGERLDQKLPSGASYSLISSPSQRAIQTAQVLLPFLRKKSKTDVVIQREDQFHELSGWAVSYEGAVEEGNKRIPVIERYGKSDVVFVSAHQHLVSAIGLAVAKHYGIGFSDTFKPEIWQPDNEDLITMAMENNGLPREDAIEWLIAEYPDIFWHPPPIPEPAAVYFNLENKVVEMIDSGLRSI